MFSINSLFNMGRTSLFANQTALQVTGENISNLNTEGYSRRTVRFAEGISINSNPGQLGTGAYAAEVVRSFDELVEEQYLDKNSTSRRWMNIYENLSGVESLFNESEGYGLSETLSNFFQGWTDLTELPDDYGTRNSLMNYAETLTTTLRQTNADLAQMQQSINERISEDVSDANSLIAQIAEVNRQIGINDIPGVNNANSLYDQRDQLVRDLSDIMDVDIIDNGGSDYTVLTKSGQTLVNGTDTFTLSFESAQAFADLRPSSTFDGSIYWEGQSNYEYTIQMTSAGGVGSGGAATYRVSLDGGKTWMTDENGHEKEFYADDSTGKIDIEGVNIWFGSSTDPTGTATGQFAVGDTFTVVPKSALYWVENTSHKENITPQISFDGEDNSRRLTGGSLAGYFNFRDDLVGEYRDKLDALANSLIWEVNRRHSQGVGLERMTFVDGTYSTVRDDVPLGSNASGLSYAERLTSGSSMIYIYDGDGNIVDSGALDFDPLTPGQQNFDPSQHSLTDVVNAYNSTFGTYLTASIVDHKLRLESKSDYEMAWGTDTTGLNAALGINTFFTGDDASSISINNTIGSNLDLLCTGHVNGGDESNSGDATTASAISALQTELVNISSVKDGTTSQSLISFYNGLVGLIGADTSTSSFNSSFYESLANDLDARQQEVSGVNLDEELTNLVKYQHSYSAAAKLITTADEMMQTILGLKA